MIEIRDLIYTYPNADEPALKNLSVQFPRENVFAVLGQSGSGKTTLLNCIARFLTPTSGSIHIDDKNIADMTELEFRHTLGVVFQRLNLFPHLSVLRNLTLAPEKVFGTSLADARKQAREMLERLGIGDLADRYPAQISGGQAQRVAIARGLMLQPSYMLLDEPTSALDAQTTQDFAAWLTELSSETSFIIVTHDLPFAEMVASHGVYLSQGEIQATGNVADILQQVQQPTS
ncbi:MAG: amino acid ABC transporter ATP-binding protein [Phycisphaeraceae bacterium JB051]